MPIRPENRGKYPANWKEISRRIRFGRAGGFCEHCGAPHGVTVLRLDVQPDLWRYLIEGEGPFDGRWYRVKIILTCAHLNHDETDSRDENLKALCQLCHNRYDAEHRKQTRRATKEKKACPLLRDQLTKEVPNGDEAAQGGQAAGR